MSSISDQYRIIATGAGWAAKSDRGRLRFEGADAVSFLQALLSNDLARLAAGAGTYATYLTPQGRMIADLRIYHRDSYLLVDVGPGLAEGLAARFDGLVFAEDLQIADVTGLFDQHMVAGPRAAEILSTTFDIDAASVESLALWGQVGAGDRVIARTDDAVQPTFEIFGPATSTAETIAAMQAAGAVEMSPALVDAMRVDAGRPAFGIDMTEETIPLEAGLLERAISTDKGCYVGQEVIIRVLHRGGGRVARRLVRMAFDAGIGDPPGVASALADDGREVGQLTSVAESLDGAGWTALGYVKRDVAEAGRRVSLAERPEVSGLVTGLAG